MATSQWRAGDGSPTLKLWDEAETPCAGPSGPGGGHAPTADWTLSEFFARWFLPVVLAGEGETSPSTVGLYRDAVVWWARLTGDPPIKQIDAYTVAKFLEGLRAATYRRGLRGPARPLAEYTQRKHQVAIRALLRRLGAGPGDDERSFAELVPRPPRLKVARAAAGEPKPTWSLVEARGIFAACHQLRPPELADVAAGDWWRALVLVLYSTGVRIGTARRLEWNMVEERADGWWLKIPKRIVPKTHKPIAIPLTSETHAALLRLKRSGQAAVFVWPHCLRHLATCHDRLQQLAGLARAARHSPQAWRRLHGQQLALLGAEEGQRVAQAALDHADGKTTSRHYVDLKNLLIRRLPPLSSGPGAADPQRRLF